MGKMDEITPFYFATGIRGSVRYLLGKENYYRRREVGGPVLTSYGGSSLVVDRLCYQARGQDTAVTCFTFDFVVGKEQCAASMFGSLLKQVVGGMEGIPEELSRALKEQKGVIGGRGPQLADIVKMLQAISSRRTFMY